MCNFYFCFILTVGIRGTGGQDRRTHRPIPKIPTVPLSTN